MAASPGSRPRLRIPRSPLEKILEVLCVLGLAFIIATLALSWSRIPATIPTHFNAAGQPDSYGGKGTLFVSPVIACVLYGLLTLLSFFPQVFNFPWAITAQNAWEQYRLARAMLAWLKVELIAIVAYINWLLLQTSLGQASGLGFWFLPVALVAVFATIGVYLRLLYRAR
ncbi:MAG TPA: DUF1648 domain-containing protein [Ktedonobacterales bacterium]